MMLTGFRFDQGVCLGLGELSITHSICAILRSPSRRDGKTRTHVGKRRRTGGIVCNQLPAGMSAALEADAEAVHDGGEGQRGG